MNREPMTHDEIVDIVRRVQSGEDRKDIAARYGITRSTITNYMRRYDLARATERGPRRTVAHEWMADAACVDPDTQLPIAGWMRTVENGRETRTVRYAHFTEWHVKRQAKVCQGCPVKAECRDYGRQFADGQASWPRGLGPVYGALPPPKMAELRRAS